MRSEAEMLDLILTTARNDRRIRAVILNGSRANPNAPGDIFQDYDIVYLVEDLDPFVNNLDWISRFGRLMILQMPDAMQNPPPEDWGGFAYLMQFSDGNRIDLTLLSVGLRDRLTQDSLSLLLLDKDGLFEPFPPPTERDYLPQPPSLKDFSDCCNEFWWVCTYVAKGLWREEIIYAKYMFDEVVREQLMKMLVWQIGIQTQFKANPGKHGKYFSRYLPPELWEMLQNTYSDADFDRTWDALETMCDLFRASSTRVAEAFGFAYPDTEDQNVTAHIKHIRSLPKDSFEVYKSS